MGTRQRIFVTLVSLLSIGNHVRAKNATNDSIPQEKFAVDLPPGKIEISDESPYCTPGLLGLSCNFHGTEQVIVIPDGLKPRVSLHSINVIRANILHIFPTCLFWVQVLDTELVTTLQKKDSSNAHECRTWLRIERSNVDTISSGVKSLSMYNSTVNTISLVAVDYFAVFNSEIDAIDLLHWNTSQSALHNTTVGGLYGMIAGSGFSVDHCHIGFIASNGMVFESRVMDVTDTSIGSIAQDGLRIKSGRVTFTNVTIDGMEASAITLDNPEALLVFNNVTISNATAKSIVLLDVDRIVIEKSTVDGEELNLTSQYFFYLENYLLPENSTEIFIEEEEEADCSFTNTTLTCDFSGVEEVMVIVAADMMKYQVVQIKNTKYFHMHSAACSVELQLTSVNGTLPHFVPDAAPIYSESAGSSVDPDPCKMSLSTSDSELEVVNGKYISNMTLNNTSLGRLHEGSIGTFKSYNTKVDIIDSVNITGTGNEWLDLQVKSFYNVTLQGPVIAPGFSVSKKMTRGALIIDHPNETTEFSGTWFPNVMSDAIRVKNGSTLILKDVNVEFLHEESIYVEEGGFLHLELFKPRIFLYGSISVANKSQVTIRNSFRGLKSDVVQVRHYAVHTNSSITISNPADSLYCRPIMFYNLLCDFTKYDNVSVALDVEGEHHDGQVLEIRNATYVTIYPSCVDKVYLSSVTEATTVDIESSCTAKLMASNVRFKNIVSGVNELALISCEVDKINLYKELEDINFSYTSVKEITALTLSGFTGFISDSRLDSVEGLIAASQIMAHNTTISNIKANGVTLLAGGILANCIIGEVAPGGITVMGALHLENVTINRLHEEAIIVEDGILMMTNVTIRKSDKRSIVAKPSGGVAMEDVTVAGKKVRWHGYIVDNSSANDYSAVFYMVDPNETNGITLPPVIPGQVTPATAVTPASVNDTRSPWKVASVILIVILILMLLICIFGVLKYARSKGIAPTAGISFQVREDNHHLLDDYSSL